MNQLQIFNNSEFGEIRLVEISGKPFVVGNDVATALGYRRPYEAVSSHCRGAVSHRILTNGGEQEVKVIPEGDIYRLVMRASEQSTNIDIRKKAERYERWVFDEVLPSIRKHGMYAKDELLDNPDLLLDVVIKLKEEREEKLLLQSKIEQDKPKVLFAEALQVSNSTILIGELAKLLKQNGMDIGQNRLFERLRAEGYLGKTGEYYNIPTQRSMDLNLFKIKTNSIANADGSIRVTKTTKVTGKGQMYFINKFQNELVGV